MPEAEGSGKRFKREEFFDRLQTGWAISFPACRGSRPTNSGSRDSLASSGGRIFIGDGEEESFPKNEGAEAPGGWI
jgi:hypothetical protein